MGSVSHEQEPAAPAHQGASAASAGADGAPGAPGAAGAASPMGRYGPLVSITRFDTAPRELEWQLPLDGELYRLIPGPDRPDYSLLVLDRPLHFYPAPGFDLGRVEAEQRVEDRKGRPMVRVHALLVCARFVGQQLQPGMHDLAVNIAYVIDNSLARDAVVDFSKIEVAAVGFLSEGHAGGAAPAGAAPTSDGAPPASTGPAPTGPVPTGPAPTAENVVADAARVLRDGVAAHRGRPVGRLSATLVVGPDHRLAGLSGNADGEAPVPTEETFEQVNAVLARLADAAEAAAGSPDDPSADDGVPRGERRFTVRVEGDAVEVDKNHDARA